MLSIKTTIIYIYFLTIDGRKFSKFGYIILRVENEKDTII